MGVRERGREKERGGKQPAGPSRGRSWPRAQVPSGELAVRSDILGLAARVWKGPTSRTTALSPVLAAGGDLYPLRDRHHVAVEHLLVASVVERLRYQSVRLVSRPPASKKASESRWDTGYRTQGTGYNNTEHNNTATLQDNPQGQNNTAQNTSTHIRGRLHPTHTSAHKKRTDVAKHAQSKGRNSILLGDRSRGRR